MVRRKNAGGGPGARAGGAIAGRGAQHGVADARADARGGGPTALGAYVFAGGFTVGVAEHFKVLAHLEDGPFGADTARRNFPGLEVVEDRAAWRPERFRGRVDLVYCNPPCSPWSSARVRASGARKGDAEDWRSNPKAQCVARAFALLDAVRPVVWTFESVRQVHSKGSEMIDDMVKSAARLGYTATHVLTEASAHGVPQFRKRYFLVLSRVRIDWMPDRAGEPCLRRALARASKVDDMLANTPKQIAAIASDIRNGENARKAWERAAASHAGATSNRPAFLYDRLHESGVSYTMLGTPNKLHPDEDRLLSVNETRELCGFPQSFRLFGNAARRYAELGRGVMPPVGRWLAKNVRAAIARGQAATGEETVVTVTAGEVSVKRVG